MAGMQDYIEQLENQSLKTTLDKVPFNVRLDTLDAFMLDSLAQRYSKKKSAFAAEILKIAIADAWQAAGLEDVNESEELQKQYGSFVRSLKKSSKPKEA